METEILKLEQEIGKSVNEIARLIELKYRDFLPYFVTLTDSQDAIQVVIKNVNEKLRDLGNQMETVNSKLCSMDYDSSKKWFMAKDFVERLGVLNEVESILNTIWVSSDGLQGGNNLLTATQRILRLNELYQILNTSGEGDAQQYLEIIADRISPLLFAEIHSRKSELRYQLNEFYDSFLKFSVANNHTELMFYRKTPKELSEIFTAMKKLSMFESKLCELVELIWESFVTKIINAVDPSSVVQHRDNELDNTISFCVENHIESTQKSDVKSVLDSVVKFFAKLVTNFKPINIEGQPFIDLFDEYISPQLITKLEKDCLVPSIPSIECESHMKDLIKVTDLFIQKMKELGFFESLRNLPFEYFFNNHHKIAIDRHCQDLVKRAKELLKKPYIDLIKAEPLDHEKFECAANKLQEKAGHTVKHESFKNNLKFLESEFMFESCSISSSIYEYVGLVRSIIISAEEAESDVEACRFSSIVRNILEFFTDVSFEAHRQSLSTVPQIAAVFFNNCHYVCHCIMTVGVDILMNVGEKSPSKFLDNEFNFTDLLSSIKTVAANLLEQQILYMQRQLTLTIGDGRNLFVGLRNDDVYKSCMRTINGCLMQIKQVSEVWKEVMMKSILINSIGMLSSHILNKLSDIILATEDFTQSDSEIIANIVDSLLKNLIELNTIEGVSNIQKVCEEPYYKMIEIVFCLRGTLMEIGNRWCEGKGSLALWLKPNQAKQLIRALFQNTDRRAHLLSLIT